MADKNEDLGYVINLLWVIFNFIIIRTLLSNIYLLVMINNKVN